MSVQKPYICRRVGLLASDSIFSCLLFCLMLVLPIGLEKPAAAAGAPRNPKILPGFSISEHLSLALAFGTAAKKVQKEESCRALFNDLDLEGIEALRRTYYEPAAMLSDISLCNRGAVALTGLHGRRTRLCGSFRSHSRRDQVAFLIHEALHIAGLSEKPIDPGGMTPHEITQSVKLACGL